jgi:tetratricopeptide (TPR) repeat protein
LLPCPGLDESDALKPVEYYCLRAELSLDTGEEVAASDALTQISTLSPQPDNIRQLGIQARLDLCRGKSKEAQTSYDAALKVGNLDLPTCLSLSETAVGLGHWDDAVRLAEQAIQLAPAEPLPYLNLARILVLRAETQRFFNELETIQHLPGEQSIQDQTRQTFENALKSAVELAIPIPSEIQETGDESALPPDLARWQERGQAAFTISPSSKLVLAMLAQPARNPEDLAAHIACWRYANMKSTKGLGGSTSLRDIQELSEIQLPQFMQDPNVQIQLSMALSLADDPVDAGAVQAAQQAVNAVWPQDGSILRASEDQVAVIQAALAHVALHAGQNEAALKAIQSALEIWPEEPRWQAMAGHIKLMQENLTSALPHLEQAALLEPQYVPHLLILGQTYLALSEKNSTLLSRAIQTLERASTLDSERSEIWISLSRAYRQACSLPSLDRGKNLEKAAFAADRSISLAADKSEALILRAEIALLADDPRTAYQCSQEALKISKPGWPAYDPTLNVLIMARALEELKRPTEALEMIEQALSTVNDPLPLLLTRTQLLRLIKGTQAALDALQDLGKCYPTEAAVLIPLARALGEASQTENAIHTAQRALQALSQEEIPINPLFTEKESLFPALNMNDQAGLHLMLGSLLRQAGQLDQSIYHLNESIHLDPTLVDAYLEVGRAHQERRQHNQALQAYNQASAVAPLDPRPYYQASQAMKESKDYLGAETMLRRAAALAPNDLNIHRQLAAVVAVNLVHNPHRTASTHPDL